MPQPSIPEICLKITCLRFHSCLPGANELTFQVLVLCVNGIETWPQWWQQSFCEILRQWKYQIPSLHDCVANMTMKYISHIDLQLSLSYITLCFTFMLSTPLIISLFQTRAALCLTLILEWFISLFIISHCTFHLLRNLQCLADGEFAEFGSLPSAFCCCIYKGLKPLYVYFHHWRHLNFISVISRAFLKLYTLFLSKMLCKMQILPSMTLLDMIFIMWNNNIYKVSAFLQWVWISITVKFLI